MRNEIYVRNNDTTFYESETFARDLVESNIADVAHALTFDNLNHILLAIDCDETHHFIVFSATASRDNEKSATMQCVMISDAYESEQACLLAMIEQARVDVTELDMTATNARYSD